MRGTEIETELKDIDITAVALVESPAIGERFVLVKSEDVPPAVAPAPEGVVESLEKGPRAPNDPSPLAPSIIDGREKIVEAVKKLVKGATDWPFEIRGCVAEIAKYHGVEAPDMKADEAPPAGLDSAIARIENIAGMLQQIIIAQASQPAVVTPAPAAKPAPVKKDEPVPEVTAQSLAHTIVVPPELAASVQKNRENTGKLMEDLNNLTRSLRKAMGKDPDGDR